MKRSYAVVLAIVALSSAQTTKVHAREALEKSAVPVPIFPSADSKSLKSAPPESGQPKKRPAPPLPVDEAQGSSKVIPLPPEKSAGTGKGPLGPGIGGARNGPEMPTPGARNANKGPQPPSPDEIKNKSAGPLPPS